ncbi:MAG: DUF2779 domain-containing protein [Candidatus Bathyarchaeota archaeon]|nr:DUF2779 domain-containing protein [Candidatus Bathyarchaeota archaeon]
MIEDTNIVTASQTTIRLMKKPQVNVIFEAAFTADNMNVRVDALKRDGDKWQIIEVKDSVNDKNEFVDDMAYTLMVILRANIPISKVSLMLLSKEYRLGMSTEKLFTEIDHTEEVQKKAAIFEGLRQKIDLETSTDSKPTSALKFECKACPVFEQCTGSGIKNYILEIPRISKSKFTKLMEEGYSRIEQIPEDFDLSPFQSRVRNCVRSQKPFVGKELKETLDRIIFPAYYLDFETLSTAIPIYQNVAPWEPILSQYSIHVCSTVGKITNHLEYLADPLQDCRRELAENLIKDLAGQGSVIVYSGFENGKIKAMASLYPDLAQALNEVTGRLVDLLAIITQSFYHPNFYGSTSIKVVLPTLVPKLSYDDLEIRNGGVATAAFTYMALGKIKGEKVQKVRQDLLRYCERDTLAMVEIHKELMSYV